MEQGIATILKGLHEGDFLSVSRAISMVENAHPLAEDLLLSLRPNPGIPIIGITGPPGAGKSTLLSAITKRLVSLGKKVAVLAIDPSSPFNQGALLGDRIRMSANFNDPHVFIRSMASRGALGGLAEKTIEITDVLRSSGFDVILVETVGVGQSEIDIVGLADLTLVVLVPESGDEVQHVKSGLMEIADVFVLNKADREGADHFASLLRQMLMQKNEMIPLLKTVADKEIGVDVLVDTLMDDRFRQRRALDLLTEKAWRLIQQKKMAGIDRLGLKAHLQDLSLVDGFNLYRYINEHY